jgi:lipopolysaccharide export system ATP-binding protein
VEPAERGAMKGLFTSDLTKSFRGRRVVDGVSVEVHRSEVVGLLGPNGAGKTTTFNMIVGLIRPEEGLITLDGSDITGLPMHIRARKGIGYLTQEPSIFRKLTVEQNILGLLETFESIPERRRERLDELLDQLKISSLAHQRGYTLSGGERRRVEIARALVTKPSFLLLDEPFTGIDPIVRSDIQSIVSDLRSRGLGILITDHNVRDTLEITDRAYIMYEGRILISGSAAQLVADPKARKIYLGEKFTL